MTDGIVAFAYHGSAVADPCHPLWRGSDHINAGVLPLL
jgi:hypothetical protein